MKFEQCVTLMEDDKKELFKIVKGDSFLEDKLVLILDEMNVQDRIFFVNNISNYKNIKDYILNRELLEAEENSSQGLGTSLQSTFDLHYTNYTEQQILSKNVTSEGHLILRIGKGFFFLVKDKEYVGHIELDSNKIVSSYLKLSRGFYKVMFTSILGLTEIKEILSDVSLSALAISSYQKLQDIFDISVLTSEGYESFSKDILLREYRNRISVKEKEPGVLKEKILEYNKRLNNDTYSKMLVEKNRFLNCFLYKDRLFYECV